MRNIAKQLQPRTWRTEDTHCRYLEERKEAVASDVCPLCSEASIVEYRYWRVIPNKYPYDAVAQRHTMLVPKQHLQEHELSNEAQRELYDLKHGELNEEYKYIMEALPTTKSIPGHFHLHLIDPMTIE